MNNMTWVKKVEIDTSDMNKEEEASPAKISNKFTPKYLDDGDVESFRKMPKEQAAARYEGRFSGSSTITPDKNKKSQDNDDVSTLSGEETVHTLATRMSTVEDGMADMNSNMRHMSSQFDQMITCLSATGLMGRRSQTQENETPQAPGPGGSA